MIELFCAKRIVFVLLCGCGLSVGVTTKIVAGIVLGFFLFASVFIAIGAGQFCIDLANARFGKCRGALANVRTVASGFFGSLPGFDFSSIPVTDAITIPTVIRVSYRLHRTAAIKACALTGGKAVPAFMSAIAVLMTIIIAVDYTTIMVAAILPSLFVYFGLLLQVEACAARKGLVVIEPNALTSARAVLRRGWPFLSATRSFSRVYFMRGRNNSRSGTLVW